MNKNVPNEVLWSGKPIQGLRLNGYDIFLIPLSIWWCWDIPNRLLESFSPGSSLGNKFFAITLLAIGSYLLLVRYFNEAYVRVNTTYYVINDGIVFEYSGLFKKSVTVPVAEINLVGLSNYHKNRASIIFNGTDNLWAARENFPSFMLTENEWQVGFDQVEKAKQVKALIQDIIDSS